MRMIFTCEHDGPFNKVIGRVHHETMNEYLPDILEDFELFLKGCGFNFDGKLDIISAREFYGIDEPQVPEYFDELLNRHEGNNAD